MIGYGLDIGGTKTLGVCLDGDGRVVAEVREPTERGPEGLLRTAERSLRRLRDATGEAPGWPVGIGVPGLVDATAGTVQHAVNLGVDGDPVPLRDRLAERLAGPVSLENDVNVATWGARALTGAGDLAYLSIGTGLAAGLMLDGRLRRGAFGAAGEIGHVPVDPAGLACQCGQRGCLETIASGSAVAAAWPTSDQPPAQALFAAAATGHPRAIVARDRFAAGVAAAVRLLALTVDVEVVVLGGGVSQVGSPLADAVSDALRAQAGESDFLAALDLPSRVRVLDAAVPVAAIGAALLGRPEPV